MDKRAFKLAWGILAIYIFMLSSGCTAKRFGLKQKRRKMNKNPKETAVYLRIQAVYTRQKNFNKNKITLIKAEEISYPAVGLCAVHEANAND